MGSDWGIFHRAKRKIIIEAYKAFKVKSPALKYVIAMPEAPDFSHIEMTDLKNEFVAAGRKRSPKRHWYGFVGVGS